MTYHAGDPLCCCDCAELVSATRFAMQHVGWSLCRRTAALQEPLVPAPQWYVPKHPPHGTKKSPRTYPKKGNSLLLPRVFNKKNRPDNKNYETKPQILPKQPLNTTEQPSQQKSYQKPPQISPENPPNPDQKKPEILPKKVPNLAEKPPKKSKKFKKNPNVTKNTQNLSQKPP